MTKRRLHIYFDWNESFPDGFSSAHTDGKRAVIKAKKESRSYFLFMMDTGGIQVRVQKSLYHEISFNSYFNEHKDKINTYALMPHSRVIELKFGLKHFRNWHQKAATNCRYLDLSSTSEGINFISTLVRSGRTRNHHHTVFTI